MFGSDNNSLSKKINAQQQRKVKKWGRGAGPMPVLGDQEYLEELAIQAKEKRRLQEEEAKKDKEEIFQHYKNYSLGTSERGKDLWTEEEEAELYKEPTHTAVNTIREDLFGGKPNEAQESYSFNRHRPRRLEQLNNKNIIEEDGMSQLSSKLSQGSSQPKGKREEAYEKKKMIRMMKRNGDGGLFDDDNVSPMSSNQQQNAYGSDTRSKSTPKNISQRDLVYEQKRQAMREKNPIIQRRRPQEITQDPESDYENDQVKYVDNNKPNYAKPTRKKNQEITHDPESDYEHEQEKYTEQNRNNIQKPKPRIKKNGVTHDPESDYENEQEKYRFQEAHIDPKRLSRNGISQSQPQSTVVTPLIEPNGHRSNSNSNSRDYNFAAKGGNIFDKMGSNDPPIPRRRGLNRLYNDYPPSPNNNSQIGGQNQTPFQQLPPAQSQNGYNPNSLQTPRSYSDENYHRSVSNNNSRHQTAVAHSPDNDFYIGSSANSAYSGSPITHTRKQTFKSEQYGRDDNGRKQQQQAEYRLQLQQQMDQRGNQKSKKKDFQEDVLLPSQKSQEDELRSPSSKFSNQHFHQLESNLPFGSGDPKPKTPVKAPSSITSIGVADNSKAKLQKQMEYQEELKKQLEAKKNAEEERKRKDEEMDRKIEENIRKQAEIDRLQVEKERREKEAKTNPNVAVGDVKSNQSAVPEPVRDLKSDLFGSPTEAKRSRRQKDAIIMEDSVPPPVKPVALDDVVIEPPTPNLAHLRNNQNPPMNIGGMLPNIHQTPQLIQMNQDIEMLQMQLKQQQMLSELSNQVDKNVISYLLTQLLQQKPLNLNVQYPQQQPLNIQQPVVPSLNYQPLNISSNSHEDEKLEPPVSSRSRSISNPVKPVAMEQVKDIPIDERPLRRKPKREENSDNDEAVIPKKEPEAAPIRRQRKKKPSLEDELEDPKPSKVRDEGPPSASKKSKRVFKIGGQKNAEEEDEHEVAAQPKMPKPGVRSKRVFSVGKGNPNHESSPIHTQPLSDEEYRNLDSDN